MRLISALVIGLIALYSYKSGVANAAVDKISITAILAQLAFVLFAFLAILLLLRSFEKDPFWPWNWHFRRASSTAARPDTVERRTGVDRRRDQQAWPSEKERRLSSRPDRRMSMA